MFLKRCSPGFTLVELMVAVALGLFVLSVTATMYMTTFAANEQNLKTTRLNQELRAIMNLAVNDLRRAGHWGLTANLATSSFAQTLTLGAGDPANVSAVIPNIFTQLGAGASQKRFIALRGTTCRGTVTSNMDGTAFTIDFIDSDFGAGLCTGPFEPGGWTIVDTFFATTTLVDRQSPQNQDLNTTPDCIIYRADLDGDGRGDEVDDEDEILGLRFDVTEGAIERLRANQSAVAADCSGGTWENLNDQSSVEILAFDVIDRTTTRPNIRPNINLDIREFQVRLRGRLRLPSGVERSLETTVERQLEQFVKLRNDRLVVL